MTATVLHLPTGRRRRRTGTTPRRTSATPAPLVDLAAYRRARAARVRSRRREADDEEESDGWAEPVHHVIDAAEDLLAAGRAAEVVEFCTLAAGFLGRNAADLGDPRTMLGVTSRLGELRARASGRGEGRW